MFKRSKIPCYVLIFDQVQIIQDCLDFLITYADQLDIVLIENPSRNTKKIKRVIEPHIKSGRVKRHYLMNENVTGNAFISVLNAESAIIKKHKYVYLTDGDLTVASIRWIDEQVKILRRNKQVFSCGVTLDKSNLPLASFPDAKSWVPADIKEEKDYYEAYTGGHLILLRSRSLIEYLKWLDDNKFSFVDANMHKYCYEIMQQKWARTKEAKAYHLTWDLYKDRDHPYTKLKTSKTFKGMWKHKRNADYELVSY